MITTNDLLEQREQMQNDIMCIAESQLEGTLNDEDYQQVLDDLCQVVVDKMNILIDKLDPNHAKKVEEIKENLRTKGTPG